MIGKREAAGKRIKEKGKMVSLVSTNKLNYCEQACIDCLLLYIPI